MSYARHLEAGCVERFLRYVRFDTRSDEASNSYPSTAKQLELLRTLRDELEALGLDDVAMDRHGYVTATIPATVPADAAAEVPVIGFVAHVDTSPEMPGHGVEPILHRDYRGQRIQLPHDPDAVLDPEIHPELLEAVGHDIVTASGKTLLGADDKAGVAEIMAAADFLMSRPDIPHGNIRVAFTPDEEIGRGTDFFDVEAFGARFAYTLDGGGRGCLEAETFSADSMRITFKGFNTHPGYAKGEMVNAVKVAADFIHRLPKDALSPETTEGYEGYVHPNSLDAAVDRTSVDLLIRAFDTPGLQEKERWLEELAAATAADWPGTTVEVEIQESYRNMREILDRHPEVLEIARTAIKDADLELRESPIRGGTDGSRLSFMGLPTPNLSSGQHNIHSRLEWADCWEMAKAAEVMVRICELWAARTP
ncbi:MAG: peptidase T [Acidobacteriota bacterium]